MLQFEEFKQQLHAMRPEIEEIGAALDLEAAAKEIEQLEAQAAEPDFWSDLENSQKVLQRIKQLKDRRNIYESLRREAACLHV